VKRFYIKIFMILKKIFSPMRIKVTAATIIVTGFIIAIAFHFIAIAATDAPHNESNNINCGSCHGEGLLNSPFWGGTMSYDQLCLNCHNASSGPYSDTNAPLAVTHSSQTTSDKYGDWTRECRTCHNPHYQRQKVYKNTDANNLYLATGTITNCVYNGDNTSTLTYSTITYKTGWDSTKLTEKTGEYRHTVLFPNINKLGYNYPIIAVDTPTANTITVTGNACTYLYPPTTFAAMYGQYIKDVIDVNGTSKQVKFFDQTGTNSYGDGDGDGTYNGICEVCHTQTDHFRNNGGAPDQNHANVCEAAGTNCITCHNHRNGLGHGGGGSETNCVDCHGHDDGWNGGTYYGTTQSHSTHTENDADDLKGPHITCDTCHDTNIFPCFKSGTDSNGDGRYDLSETDVCDNCHSPVGSFDGVQMAKDSWHEGVYAGSTLRAGKEKWCVGCHDDQPANSKADATGINAPNIAGDNITFGFYVNGHKSRLCSECHDLNTKHIDGDPRTYAFNSAYYGPSQSGIAYASGYRLRYIDGEVPLMIPSNYSITFSYNAQTMKDNAFRLCFDCHQSATILDNTPGDGIGSNFKASLPNPPRNYSYAWGSGADVNEHVAHIMNYVGPFWDSDWDTGTTGAGGSDGQDSLLACSSCHNVHGSAVTHGSTNEPMIRDGSLVGRTGYGFSYVIEDVANGGYPMVTSSGATQEISHGAIFRNNTANMCGGSMCHGNPTPPSGSSYDASGSSWGTYLEYYRVPK
jgi:hypothetical protein